MDRVRNKDYAVQNEAKKAGGSAVAGLSGLLRDPDEEVRQLAVYCLSATGDTSAAGALSSAIFDSDPQVAMAAAKGLMDVATPADAPTLKKALGAQPDGLVRRQIALVLGRIASPADLPELKKQWEGELDGSAKQGLTAALSKMGDRDAQDAFKKALAGAIGVSRLPYLELAEYISQPWLLKPLKGVLSDRHDVVRIAVDGIDDMPQALRTCDLGVVLIAAIGGGRWSFQVLRNKNFTTQQLDEVAQWVDTHAP